MFVVAGVTGNTGKVVADTLLTQKQPVRVIVRTKEAGAPWLARGAEVAVAALDDVPALTKALEGAKGAYLLLPPQMASNDSLTENAKRAAGYAKAIDASGVAHVVLLSSVGAQHPDGTGPIKSLHDAEAKLRATKAATTFVRAAYFMENLGGSLYALGQGQLPVFFKANVPIAMIASHDIGTTAAKALLEGGKGHTIIELSGPRDYSPADAAAALTRLTGKPIAVAEGPEDAMIPALTGAGLNAHWAGLYKEMTHGINTGHVTFQGPPARAIRGTTELETVLKTLLPK